MTDPARLARLAARAADRAATFLRTTPPPAHDRWDAKGHHDYVTAVDRGAEERITETLLRAEPGSRILGEELAPEATDLGGLVWVVDPLDGTTNFLHRYPVFAVSIGAAIDGELVAGCVIHVPLGLRALAWRGGGAWIGGDRLRVSAIADPPRALVGTGFPFKHPELLPRYLPQLERILGATSGIRRAGAAAIDLLDLAAGRFDAFWELMLAPWDTAAGIVLVREAGGLVTDLDGAPARVGHHGIVAGNPPMHEWLMKQL